MRIREVTGMTLKKKNDMIRIIISERIDGLKPQQTIKTENITAQVMKKYRHWSIDNYQIGDLIRENGGVRHIGPCTWEKVSS